MKLINWSFFGFLMFILCLLLSPVSSAGTFPTNSPEETEQIVAELRAAQFLTQATFGPNKAEIRALAERIKDIGASNAFEEWIDNQFSMLPTLHHPLAKQMVRDDGFPDYVGDGLLPHRYPRSAWWHTALTAPDQLRQRMAWALAQIFVINDFNSNFRRAYVEPNTGEPMYLGVANYYDVLVGNAFGNYRNLLEDVTLHPVMGVFLSHLNNQKGDDSAGIFPDENFAREVMQLFSIGLYELDVDGQNKIENGEPIPTYDNDDIMNFARVFTGLHYAQAPFGATDLPNVNLHEPMEMSDDHHDTNKKKLLNGKVLPEGQTGLKDIADAMNNLFGHPNVGPFIARRLIQRFVKSNPTRQYIADVATAFNGGFGGGIGSISKRGDFKAVLKAILLHPEALGSYGISYGFFGDVLVYRNGDLSGRLQEPVLRYTAFLRAFDPSSTYPTGRFMLWKMKRYLGQSPYKAPHVFNFYLPDHVPRGPLQDYDPPAGTLPNDAVVAPEFEILTAVNLSLISNQFLKDVRYWEARHPSMKINFIDDEERALASMPDIYPLLRHLDLYLCRGAMFDAEIDIIAEAVTQELPDPSVQAFARQKESIKSVLLSPGCAVH